MGATEKEILMPTIKDLQKEIEKKKKTFMGFNSVEEEKFNVKHMEGWAIWRRITRRIVTNSMKHISSKTNTKIPKMFEKLGLKGIPEFKTRISKCNNRCRKEDKIYHNRKM